MIRSLFVTSLILCGCGSSAAPASAPSAVPSAAAPAPAPIHRAEVERAIDEGLGSLLGRADIAPVKRKGSFVGFAVTGFDGPLGRVGLEPGDVLVRVGGKPIATPDEAQLAFEALRQAPSIVLEIERGGTPKTVTTPVLP